MTAPRPKVQPNDRILRLQAVLEFCAISETQLFDLIRRGQFPRPIKISDRGRGWLWSELRAWLDARIAERDSAA
jgi:prophage regulatory protein